MKRNFQVYFAEDGSFTTSDSKPFEVSAGESRAGESMSPRPVSLAVEPMKRNAFRSILDTELGVPINKLAKVVVRKLGEEKLQEKHLARAQEIISIGAPTASQDVSIYRAFTRWRIQQGLESVKLGQVMCVFVEATTLIASNCYAKCTVLYGTKSVW